MRRRVKHRKNDEKETKSQFTATATEPRRKRKVRQFNNDQYYTNIKYDKFMDTNNMIKFGLNFVCRSEDRTELRYLDFVGTIFTSLRITGSDN